MKYIPAVLIFLFLYSCKDTGVNTPPIATEYWLLTMPFVHDSLHLTLYQMPDSSVSIQGQWTYLYGEKTITCNHMNGFGTIVDSSLSLNATGEALFPPDSLGIVPKSEFSMQINGTFYNGISEGTWKILFNNELLLDSLQGNYVGYLRSGTGVTPGT
jgi:hypothetical protein